MGVKRLLVQGGTFQNPVLFTGSYLSRTPSIPSPGAPGHPARKEAASPPPTPGPSAGNPRTTLGTLTTFLRGWAPPLGLETRLWACSLPRGTTETPSHWACHPPVAGYPAHGGATCGAQELLPAIPRATPAGGLGRGRPLGRSIPVSGAVSCHPVPSSAFVRLCLCSPHCQAANTSWKALRMSL